MKRDDLPNSQTVDAVLGDFRKCLKTGEVVTVEEYLERGLGPGRSDLLHGLIQTEIEWRHCIKEAVDIAEYLRRFPGREDAVSSAFEAVQRQSATATLDSTVIGTISPEMSQTVVGDDCGPIDRTVSFIVTDANGIVNRRPTLQPLDEIAPGKAINNRYQLIRELGQGGMGTVLLGEDTRLIRPVAVKFIRIDHWRSGQNQYLAAGFETEAKLAASLKHPSIATVYDYGFEGTTPYTVFELVEGESLKELIARNAPMHIDDVRELVGRIAMALDYAHEKGIVHRDLKPDNIRIDEYGVPKILDFGLARDFRSHTDWRFSGTPAYSSPEQAAELPSDGRTDQYALALIAFEMILGRRPFESRDWRQLLRCHRDELIRWPTDDALVDAAVRNGILQALSKNPNSRYSTCVGFATAIGCDVHSRQSTPAEFERTEVVEEYRRNESGRIVTSRRVVIAKQPTLLWVSGPESLRLIPLLQIDSVWRSGRRLYLQSMIEQGLKYFRFLDRRTAEIWRELLTNAIQQRAEAVPAVHDEADTPLRFPVVVPSSPTGNMRLLGPCIATGATKADAILMLQLEAAATGANAIMNFTSNKIVGLAKTHVEVGGIAARTLDAASREAVVALGYWPRVRTAAWWGLGFVFGVCLFRFVGAIVAMKMTTTMTATDLWATAAVIGALSVLPMILGISLLVTRWSQFLLPFTFTVCFLLAPEFAHSLTGWVLWYGGHADFSPKMAAGIDPIAIGLVIASSSHFRKAIRLRKHLRLLAPPTDRTQTKREIAGRTAWLLGILFAVAATTTGIVGGLSYLRT